jgi:hypothetical protein
MKKNINQTQRQGWLTLLALVIIAFAVSIGFTPLFELIEDGIAARVIGSSFGAIFVIILTMFLLNKQTEIEQESKKSERVFDEKVKIYQKILDITRDMIMDGSLTKEEINRLPFPVIRLQMLSDDEVIESFQLVFDKLNEVYSSEDQDIVEIQDDDKNEIYELLSNFAGECRKDLEISNTEIDPKIKQNTVNTISQSGKKSMDYSKFSFDGEELAKNRYVYSVIKNYIDENPGMSVNKFSQIIERSPSEMKGRKNDFELWKTYEEAIAIHKHKGSKRYFVYAKRGGNYLNDKDMVLNLVDEEICISNQWSLDSINPFINLMRSKGVRTE